ncbi:MAG: DUF6261 family protein [Tannerellaceae bacterium]|jgi:hypothetical protein|nr:DUF6261 family protein [Tannerellaceae bacterium]
MKVIRIPLKTLRNEEWFALFTVLFLKIDRIGADKIGLVKLLQRLRPLFHHADLLLKILQKSVLTEEAENADKLRGEAWQGFYTVIKGSQKQPDAAKREAAQRLFNLLKGYQPSITKGSYAEETGAIVNLLQDLKGAYSADVALLNFTDWVTSLEEAENHFLHILGEREEEYVAKPEGNLREVRREFDVVYTAAMNLLDAELVGEGKGGEVIDEDEDEPEEPEEEPSGPVEDRASESPEDDGESPTYQFVRSWNETLRKYRNLLHQRAGRRAKKEEDNISNQPIED